MRNQYEKQEKVLWYAQIMIFLGVLATWFNHMDMHTFYTINIILSVISIISLTLDRFYFSEKIGQKVHNSYSVAYGLLVIFTLLLVILYAGILKIDLIMQEETKMICGRRNSSPSVNGISVRRKSLLLKNRFIKGSWRYAEGLFKHFREITAARETIHLSDICYLFLMFDDLRQAHMNTKLIQIIHRT